MNKKPCKDFCVTSLCLLAICSFGSRSFANDVYRFVDKDNTTPSDGTTWANAYTNLQDALDEACPASSGTVYHIWVAAGKYFPDEISTPQGNRNDTFYVCGNVRLRGGFAGNENHLTYDLSNRDFDTNETILSGDLDDDDTPTESTHGENSYHVVTVFTGDDDDATLDGFTISGGYAWEANPGANDHNLFNGGGIFVGDYTDNSPPFVASHVTVNNCIIEDNYAKTDELNDDYVGYGAGLYSRGNRYPWQDYSTIDIENCSFSHNHGGKGGGCFVQDIDLEITDCSYDYNTGDWGGGLNIASDPNGVSPSVLDCTFTNNTANYGGGISAYSSLALTDCVLEDNHATLDGGGLRLLSDENPDAPLPHVHGCTFEDNQAGRDGGGVYSADGPIFSECDFIDNVLGDDDTPVGELLNGAGLFMSENAEDDNSDPKPTAITNCRFIGNTRYNSNIVSYGGGLFLNKCYADVVNCLIHDNDAEKGGGIAFKAMGDCDTDLINCTIVENSSAEDGGGVFCEFLHDHDLAFYNCVLWDNSAVGDGNEIFIDNEYDGAAVLVIEHSDVDGGLNSIDIDNAADATVDWTGNGNITDDPIFADSVNDDFRLLMCSPALDAGDNTEVPDDLTDLDADSNVSERVPYDLDGTDRFVDVDEITDTGVADSPNYPDVVDMGAYEYVHACHGDFDYSGDIALSDLAILLGSKDMPSGAMYEDGDMDCDGDVDQSDLAAFLAVYNVGCP